MKRAVGYLGIALGAGFLGSVAVAKETDQGVTLLINAMRDGKWGLIDQTGKVVAPFEYDKLYFEPGGDIGVRKGEKSGKLDRYGHLFIPAEYTDLSGFNASGFAVADKDGRQVVIDRNNHVVLGEGFEGISGFDGDRLFAVKDGKDWGVVSLDCNWIIEPKFDYIHAQAKNGLAAAQLAYDKQGIIDGAGNWVVPPGKFQAVDGFGDDGLAPAKLGGKWGYIDSTGAWAIQPIFENPYGLWHFDSAGLNSITIGDKVGVIDRQGQILISPQFDAIKNFKHGLVDAKKDGKWGRIDMKGNVVVPFQYDMITPFNKEGIARARYDKNGKWSFIDEQGKHLFDGKFEDIGVFDGAGWAAARKGGKWGAIGPKGNWLVQPTYDCIDYCGPTVVSPPMIRVVQGPHVVPQQHPEYLTKPKEQSWCRAKPAA